MRQLIDPVALVVLVFAASRAVAAQSPVSGGVEAGAALGPVSSYASPNAADAFGTTIRPGATVGAFVTVPLRQAIAFQPEVLYVQKGATLTDARGGDEEARTRLSYLEVPPLVRCPLRHSRRSRLDQYMALPGPNTLGEGASTSALTWLRWQSTLGSTVVLTERFGIAAGRFENRHESGRTQASGSRSDVSYLGAVVWTPRPSWMVRAGAFARRETDLENTFYIQSPTTNVPFGGRRMSVDGSAWTTAGDARVVWSNARGPTLEAGARVSRSMLTDATVAAPWVLVAQPLGRSLTLRAGVSVSRQQPDFDQVIGTFGSLDARPERARHLDVAVEGRPSADTRWQVTVYDRRERDVLRFEDSETRLDNANGGVLRFEADASPFWENALAGGSRGVEVLVQRRAANGVDGWIGYAYGRTRYADRVTGETFWGDFDQRHALNLFAEDRLSAKTGVSLRLRIGTGFPLPGYFDRRSGDLFAGAARNTVRLPPYARLDVRADHTFNYEHRRLTLFGEIVNVLNRTNYAPDGGGFLATGRALNFTASQFPILPSAGIRIDF